MRPADGGGIVGGKEVVAGVGIGAAAGIRVAVVGEKITYSGVGA